MDSGDAYGPMLSGTSSVLTSNVRAIALIRRSGVLLAEPCWTRSVSHIESGGRVVGPVASSVNWMFHDASLVTAGTRLGTAGGLMVTVDVF